jgi:hypothetical protein
VLMRDARGGWKGADTAFLRDHLHAATAVGRMAAAARLSSSDTASSRIRARPDASEAGRSPGSRPKSASCTQRALLRSPPQSDPMLPTRRGRSRPGPPGTARRRSASRTS